MLLDWLLRTRISNHHFRELEYGVKMCVSALVGDYDGKFVGFTFFEYLG